MKDGQYKEDVYVNSWKECLDNCDGQQFHQYQQNQQPPFTSTHWTYKMTTTYDVGNQGSWLKENETNFWFVVLQNLELITKWKYDFFYENFTRADVKARLYLIDFKFPAKHAGCHFSLISDVTPSIPIYLFNCIKTIVSFLEFRHNG